MVYSSNALDESFATVDDVISVWIEMDGYSSVPLVELVYSDGGDCQLGCAFAVDDVQSVGTVVASNRAAAGLPDIEFAERY